MIGVPLAGVVGAAGMSAGGGWTPAQLFAAGEWGAWIDALDTSTTYQDAAGTTPATAATDPVARIADKSGRGAHATNAGGSVRPVLSAVGGVQAPKFDGADDQLSIGIASIPSGGRADIHFLVSKSAAEAQAILLGDTFVYYIGCMVSGASSTEIMGSNLDLGGHHVDGTQVTTRGALHAALDDAAWHVVSAYNCNISGWPTSSFVLSGYGGFKFDGHIGAVIISEPQSSEVRYQIITYLGNQAGVSI